MPTTPTTSPTGAVTCEGSPAAERPTPPPAADADKDARRQWLATAAWPEVAFACT